MFIYHEGEILKRKKRIIFFSLVFTWISVSKELKMETIITVSLPYDAQSSGVKDSNTLESCIPRRDQSEVMLPKNTEHNQVPFPQSNR